MVAVPSAERPRSQRLRPAKRRRWLVGGVVVSILAALAVQVTAGRSGAPAYRTASVERADVDATLGLLGTIQPVNQANLNFPVAGTVGSVSAAVGQQVTVGQTLAQLDTTALDAQVASAQSAVAAAQARLASDGSSQTSGTTTASVAPAALATNITGPSDPTSAAQELVTTQQAHLIADQHRADQDLATERHDLKAETDLCQTLLSATQAGAVSPLDKRSLLSSWPSGTAPVPAAKSGSMVPQASAGSVTPLDSGRCDSALQKVLADQVAVEHDQQAVSSDVTALNAAVDKFLTSAKNTAQPRPAASGTGSSAGAASRAVGSPTGGPIAGGASRGVRTTGSPAPGPARTASPRQPASAEQLGSDQAAVDAARAQLVEAQQAHNQAQLRSPIDGTVGSVMISAGQSVQGSSGTPQIVVIGLGSHQVNTSVSDTTVGSVQVGDAATVTPSGASVPLRGQVISISLLASSNTSGSVGYPVTIGVTGTDQQLFAGQSASVSIMLAHVTGMLTVPSSAVHTAGANRSVTVLRNGTANTLRITVGVVGPTRTQVLSGLNPGDQVVLADLSRPLPTINIQNSRRVAGGGSGRPGG